LKLLRTSLAPLATVAALASGACSLLISGEAEQIQCSDEGQLGPPACDLGFSCQASICRADALPDDDSDPEAVGGAAGSGGAAGADGASGAGGSDGAGGSGGASGAGGADD